MQKMCYLEIKSVFAKQGIAIQRSSLAQFWLYIVISILQDTQIVGFMYFFISGIATLCATGTAFLRETNRVGLVDKI